MGVENGLYRFGTRRNVRSIALLSCLTTTKYSTNYIDPSHDYLCFFFHTTFLDLMVLGYFCDHPDNDHTATGFLYSAGAFPANAACFLGMEVAKQILVFLD